MPDFSRSTGAETAEAASKTATGRNWFSVKEGNVVYVRPLTEGAGLITVQMHTAVPTKPGPKAAKNWPAQMSAVCQNDQIFIVEEKGPEGLPVYDPGYGHCFIHETMAGVSGKYGPVSRSRAQTYGLFVMRERVEEGGKFVGFRDVMESYTDPQGGVHRVPRIVVASQSYSNFWGAFVSAGHMTGSIRCFDFMVKRTGPQDYDVAAGRETPDHQPGTDSWKVYEEALKITGLSVESVIVDQSTPAHYGRFFDPSVPFDEDKEAAAAEAADSTTTATAEEVAGMRDKMAAAFGSTQPT